MTRAVCIVALGVAACSARAASPDALPEWAKQAAAQAIPEYPARVSNVVLLADESVVVDADGRRTMHERGAVKVLQRGDEKLEAFRSYNSKAGRVRDFQAWLIAPGGKATAYPKNQILDIALSPRDTYDEARAKVVECGAAPPGSVFAWEVTEEEKTVFTQDGYRFQHQMPVLASRFSLTLPQGWEAKGVIFNAPTFEPVVAGSTYTWEMRNLPAIEQEDYSPGLSALAPRLTVSYFPPADNRAGLQGLKDWASVSTWLAPLVDPPAEVTATIRAKATELTAGAQDDLGKIRAIAAFTQRTSYVEVALNLTRGGGYTPRRADETLSRNYGDCKDKATLMRALLKAVGIDSWLVTITSGDRTFVRPEWASPMQFDHAIVAVRISDAVKAATVVDDSTLGRLLIFDPTDPITPVGDLPEEEQGSWALVIAGPKGALLKMPVLSAASHRIESVVDGNVDTNGKLTAHVQRQYFGQASVYLRNAEKSGGAAAVRKRFERAFARRLSAVNLAEVSMQTASDENSVSAGVDLTSERFAQSLQGKLLIVRPGLLASGGEYFFASNQRKTPVELSADLRSDTVRFKLPAGFKLDEAPGPAKIESPYGTLTAAWNVRDGEVVMTMSLEVREMVVPAADYARLRDFFDRVAGAQNAAVVLAKE